MHKINNKLKHEAQGYDEYIKSAYKFTDENGRRYQSDNLASPTPRPNLTYEYKGYKPPKNGWAISKEKMEESAKGVDTLVAQTQISNQLRDSASIHVLQLKKLK